MSPLLVPCGALEEGPGPPVLLRRCNGEKYVTLAKQKNKRYADAANNVKHADILIGMKPMLNIREA